MAAALTAAAVDRLKPPQTGRIERFDGRLPGFGVRVTATGSKSWIVLYTHRGRRRRYTIGPVETYSLAEAREAARDVMKAVHEGRDPMAERAAARRAPAADRTFAAAADAFLREHVAAFTPRGRKEARRPLERLKARWGERPLEEIGRADLIEARERRIRAGQLPAARNDLRVLRRFFRWCVESGRLEASPAADVKAPAGALRSRDRVLSDAELGLIWRAAAATAYPFGPFAQLLILTGQRRTEVAAMIWSEVDLGERLWTIPGERMKAGRAQDVPLSETAAAILADLPRLPGGAVLSSGRARGRDAAPISGFSKAKRRLAAGAEAVAAEAGVEPPADWRLHDFRRTFASGLARLRTPPHIIAAALAHSPGSMHGVTAIYNRYEYLPEKRAAMEAWAGHVEAVASAQRGGNVVPLQRA